jgi:hypothetical protein
VVYGTTPSYTYTSSTHSASVGTYTLGATAPSSGSVRFSVVATAPDGFTTTLRPSALVVAFDATSRARNPRFYFVHAGTKPRFLTKKGHQKSGIHSESFRALATSATLGLVATGITLVSGSTVVVPVLAHRSQAARYRRRIRARRAQRHLHLYRDADSPPDRGYGAFHEHPSVAFQCVNRTRDHHHSRNRIRDGTAVGNSPPVLTNLPFHDFTVVNTSIYIFDEPAFHEFYTQDF